MEQDRRNIKTLFISKIALLILLLSPNFLRGQQQMVEFGDFERWIVRDIKESFIVGGNVRRIYAVGNTDTIIGNIPLPPSTTIWGSSNAYARVIGVTKTSMSVQPDFGPTGLCAKLETCYAECKALGIVNIRVLAGGCLFWGYTIEPLSNPDEPYKNIVWGIPFTGKPKNVVLDCKVQLSTDSIITRSTPLTHSTYKGTDCAEVLFMSQYRWEDEDGNVYAKRVGTGMLYIRESTDGWITDLKVPIIYGDATQHPDYKDYMHLRDEDDPKALYYLNSKGKNVPIQEVGWADEDELPTHAVLTITSSEKGAYEGALGNIVWVDNVRLEY